jgi:DNA-binding transcriptional regulator YhcF (GntR family)
VKTKNPDKLLIEYQQRFDHFVEACNKNKGANGKKQELLQTTDSFLQFIETHHIKLVKLNSKSFVSSCSIISRQYRNLIKDLKELELRTNRILNLVSYLYSDEVVLFDPEPVLQEKAVRVDLHLALRIQLSFLQSYVSTQRSIRTHA